MKRASPGCRQPMLALLWLGLAIRTTAADAAPHAHTVIDCRGAATNCHNATESARGSLPEHGPHGVGAAHTADFKAAAEGAAVLETTHHDALDEQRQQQQQDLRQQQHGQLRGFVYPRFDVHIGVNRSISDSGTSRFTFNPHEAMPLSLPGRVSAEAAGDGPRGWRSSVGAMIVAFAGLVGALAVTLVCLFVTIQGWHAQHAALQQRLQEEQRRQLGGQPLELDVLDCSSRSDQCCSKCTKKEITDENPASPIRYAPVPSEDSRMS